MGKHGSINKFWDQEHYEEAYNVGVERPGCKESQFYSLPFGKAVASMY